MPRPSKPARLWLRPASGDRKSVWIILDGGRHIRTGCGAGDREGAEQALAEHVGRKRLAEELPRSAPADAVHVADVLAHYALVKADEVSEPKLMAGRIERLLLWWGDKTLAAVTALNCKAYAKHRIKPNPARRELEDLRAAINLAIAEGICRDAVKVTLPPKPKARSRFLTREETAKLLWEAYSFREMQMRHRGPDKGKVLPTGKFPTRHVARFILVALYTSSRSGRVWQASFEKEEGRPWVDLEGGLFFREAPNEQAPDNKRAPPIRLPTRLLVHMRRWRAKGAKYVVEYQGRAADPKKAFKRVVDRAGLADTSVVRHTFRHTSVTWLMQSGTDKWQVAGFSGMSVETLERVYGHHHPDHQKDVGNAFSTGRAGRIATKGG